MTSVEKIEIGPPPSKLPQRATIDEVWDTLPAKVSKKAKRILKTDEINLNQDGRVMHDDGAIGSSLRELILYHFKPENKKLPIDYEKFTNFIIQKKQRKSSGSNVKWDNFIDE
jgi:hypothetical protein